jgi:hypothetical protein
LHEPLASAAVVVSGPLIAGRNAFADSCSGYRLAVTVEYETGIE